MLEDVEWIFRFLIRSSPYLPSVTGSWRRVNITRRTFGALDDHISDTIAQSRSRA